MLFSGPQPRLAMQVQRLLLLGDFRGLRETVFSIIQSDALLAGGYCCLSGCVCSHTIWGGGRGQGALSPFVCCLYSDVGVRAEGRRKHSWSGFPPTDGHDLRPTRFPDSRHAAEFPFHLSRIGGETVLFLLILVQDDRGCWNLIKAKRSSGHITNIGGGVCILSVRLTFPQRNTAASTLPWVARPGGREGGRPALHMGE
jgi:hypothetical protein